MIFYYNSTNRSEWASDIMLRVRVRVRVWTNEPFGMIVTFNLWSQWLQIKLEGQKCKI